jgi:hypothetical protein
MGEAGRSSGPYIGTTTELRARGDVHVEHARHRGLTIWADVRGFDPTTDSNSSQRS